MCTRITSVALRASRCCTTSAYKGQGPLWRGRSDADKAFSSAGKVGLDGPTEVAACVAFGTCNEQISSPVTAEAAISAGPDGAGAGQVNEGTAAPLRTSERPDITVVVESPDPVDGTVVVGAGSDVPGPEDRAGEEPQAESRRSGAERATRRLPAARCLGGGASLEPLTMAGS